MKAYNSTRKKEVVSEQWSHQVRQLLSSLYSTWFCWIVLLFVRGQLLFNMQIPQRGLNGPQGLGEPNAVTIIQQCRTCLQRVHHYLFCTSQCFQRIFPKSFCFVTSLITLFSFTGGCKGLGFCLDANAGQRLPYRIREKRTFKNI